MFNEKLFFFFDDLEQGFIGSFVRDSLWLFPAIEAIHLIGLAILGGSVLVNDLRLMRLVLVNKSTIYVLDQTMKWFYIGLVVLVSTGVPLFLSEAIKCFYSRAFWIKISFLIIGIFFTLFIRNRLIRMEAKENFSLKLIGFISVFIWAIVAGSGRWIGFS